MFLLIYVFFDILWDGIMNIIKIMIVVKNIIEYIKVCVFMWRWVLLIWYGVGWWIVFIYLCIVVGYIEDIIFSYGNIWNWWYIYLMWFCFDVFCLL